MYSQCTIFIIVQPRRTTYTETLQKHTLIVLSPDADTMYLSSKSTTLTAARCPTNTLLRLMSVGDCISQTAMERSYKANGLLPSEKVLVYTGKLLINY
jgi:hypothetical protein